MIDKILSDYRDNLFIDKEHPVFRGSKFIGKQGGETGKMKHLRHFISEDAVTWSVFRTLTRLDPAYWLKRIIEEAFNRTNDDVYSAGLFLWRDVPAPKARLEWLLNNLNNPRIAKSIGAMDNPRRIADLKLNLDHWLKLAEVGRLRPGSKGCLEGDTELDILIESVNFIIAAEAKFTARASPDTTWDADRDQIGRVIDVGLSVALDKEFFFLLITDKYEHDPPMNYEELLPKYQHEQSFIKQKLPHLEPADRARLDGHIAWLTWSNIAGILEEEGATSTGEQRKWVDGLKRYLRDRELL